MERILYILGAGASANAHPLIMPQFKDGVKTFDSLSESILIFAGRVKEQGALFQKVYSLCEQAQAFATPDTFAKFLFINQRREDYRLFKIILSSFFFYNEQINIGHLCKDVRVLSFLTTVCQYGNIFPKNLNIISWNYDNQFALALNQFKHEIDDNIILKGFNRFPFHVDNTIDKNDLHMVHLNGVAGYAINDGEIRDYMYGHEPNKSLSNIFQERGLSQDYKIKDTIQAINDAQDGNLISFAWERGELSECAPNAEIRISYAQALARAATILVVIGYSFPFFNREIDQKIFAEMPGLKKIYFQDPLLNGDFLYSQFSLNRENTKVEQIKDTRNYFVPHEL